MARGTMVCRCCGAWQVEQVSVRRTLSAPPQQRLRITHYGYHVGDYPTAEEASAALARAGVDLAAMCWRPAG